MPNNQGALIAVAAVLAGAVAWAAPPEVAPQVFGAAGMAQTAASAPSAPGTGFLSGVVVDDTGRGLGGATIFVQQVAAAASQRAPMPLPIIATDPQGRFFFSALPPGTYLVDFSKAGYLALGTRPSIVLADAERKTDLRLTLTRLASLNGTLRDDNGDPIVGSEVWALARGARGAVTGLGRAGRGKSDDRGLFHIGSLPPGEYYVCACARDPIPFDGYLLTTLAADRSALIGVAMRAADVGSDVVSLDRTLRTFPPTLHPRGSTIAQASSVKLTAGEDRTGVDIDVTPARATRVSGRLSGAVGAVQAGSMRLVPAADAGAAMPVVGFTPMLVQPDGRFDFAGIPPGQYVLQVTHTSTANAAGSPSGSALAFLGSRGSGPNQGPGAGAGTATFQWAAASVSVGEEGATGLVVPLRDGLTISGRVAMPPSLAAALTPPAAARGGVTRTPVRVIAQSLAINANAAQGGVSIVQVAPDGSFNVSGLVAGFYRVDVLGLPASHLESTIVNGQDVTDLPIAIDADLADLRINVSDAPQATLAGRLTPAADGVVAVFPTDTKYWEEPAAAGRRFVTRPASVAGDFTFGPLPAGEYYVAFVQPNHFDDWRDSSVLAALASTGTRVRLTAGTTTTVTVKP